jgi:hypothetical protein
LKAPISDEMSTAGTTKRTEFQKYPCIPSHCTPVQAVPQAFAHAAKVTSLGKAMRLPLRISSSDFSDVTTITNSGSR